MSQKKTDVLPGTLDMLILQILSQGEPCHGYSIVRRIQEATTDALSVEEGALYPALHRQAKRGWVEASWGRSENNRRARFYNITPSGLTELEEQIDAWRRCSRAVDAVLVSKTTGSAS